MELFGLIGIKDIIDILIVATLLFYIYKIMKESGTLSIFLGVLAFIIVWFVASVFLKMELTGRILDKFMNIGLLILVILFQDQIKRFLVESDRISVGDLSTICFVAVRPTRSRRLPGFCRLSTPVSICRSRKLER